MSSTTWKPNPNAKPFSPASAFFSVPVPCKKTPIRIRKKGIFSRIIQWILVVVLCVTVIINLIFIWDTTRKYRTEKNSVQTAPGEINELNLRENPGKQCVIFLKRSLLSFKISALLSFRRDSGLDGNFYIFKNVNNGIFLFLVVMLMRE